MKMYSSNFILQRSCVSDYFFSLSSIVIFFFLTLYEFIYIGMNESIDSYYLDVTVRNFKNSVTNFSCMRDLKHASCHLKPTRIYLKKMRVNENIYSYYWNIDLYYLKVLMKDLNKCCIVVIWLKLINRHL